MKTDPVELWIVVVGGASAVGALGAAVASFRSANAAKRSLEGADAARRRQALVNVYEALLALRMHIQGSVWDARLIDAALGRLTAWVTDTGLDLVFSRPWFGQT
jgi:hypothetical protein